MTAPIVLMLIAAGTLRVHAPACPQAWLDTRVLTERLEATQKPHWFDTVELTFLNCEDDATLSVTVSSTTAIRTEAVGLSDVPHELRTRTLALAIAEVRPPAAAAAAPPPAPPSPPKVEVREPPPPPPRFRVGAAAHVHAVPATASVLFGGDAALHLALDDSFEIGLALGLAGGRERVAPGNISTTAAFLGATAMFHAPAGPVVLMAGPRAEVGLVWIDGDADDATAAGRARSGATGALLVSAGVERRVYEIFDLFLRLDAGYVLSGLVGVFEERTVAGYDGATIRLALGVVIAP